MSVLRASKSKIKMRGPIVPLRTTWCKIPPLSSGLEIQLEREAPESINSFEIIFPSSGFLIE